MSYNPIYFLSQHLSRKNSATFFLKKVRFFQGKYYLNLTTTINKKMSYTWLIFVDLCCIINVQFFILHYQHTVFKDSKGSLCLC